MEISVVIVTRNRAKYLAGALLSLAAQDFDGQRFEVIVGDNEDVNPRYLSLILLDIWVKSSAWAREAKLGNPYI